MMAQRPTDFQDYAQRYPAQVQRLLRQMRQTIKKAAPAASETISYGMPAFRQNRILVWYGAHAKHIGLYPGASGIAAFAHELSAYTFAKGSVQFPFDEPLPLELVTRIVTFRVNEVAGRSRRAV